MKAMANSAVSDFGLWEQVIHRDVAAFEQIVHRYQSAVAGVAFSILRDFPASQDVSQETFWAAWRDSGKLNDVNRLGPWLCGIARNLARDWQRKEHRQPDATSQTIHEPEALNADPIEHSISAEEHSIVQQSLEAMPEDYREAIVLFYHQDQNVRQVAKSLDISEDAAKQRLSRGRAMLRDRVAAVVEDVLQKSKPGRSFTASVIAGITVVSAAARAGTAAAAPMMTASAGAVSATAAKAAAGTGAALGVSGGLVGAAAGLGGAWLGTWLPQQLAPTLTERELLKAAGRKMMIVSIACTLLLLASGLLFLIPYGWIGYLIGAGVLGVAFATYIVMLTVRTNQKMQEIRSRVRPEDDPNPSALRSRWIDGNGRGRLKGRKYTSPFLLFGIPLIDIQFSDPMTDQLTSRITARGWIAVGDKARGILFACGGSAMALVAVGGVSVGAIAVGGVSLGLVSLGGVAAGVLSFGGLGIGYDAIGGGAIGWHSAAGGGAVSVHAAYGGAAVARDFAVGGLAIAESANTELAKQTLNGMRSKQLMDWYIQHRTLLLVFIVAVSLFPLAAAPLIYRREKTVDAEL